MNLINMNMNFWLAKVTVECVFLFRFMTDNFTTDIYTPEGLKWIQDTDMRSVLIRAFPEISTLSKALKNVENAFFPWPV